MSKQVQRLIGLIVILVVVIVGGWMLVKRTNVFGDNVVMKDSGSGISDYSAVFLTNGQVYFGKIYQDNSQEVDLQNIYYLQVNSANSSLQDGSKATPSPSASPDISLVKLGNELHGPNDRMLINKSQVLFTESLKSDSKVVQAINNYTAAK